MKKRYFILIKTCVMLLAMKTTAQQNIVIADNAGTNEINTIYRNEGTAYFSGSQCNAELPVLVKENNQWLILLNGKTLYYHEMDTPKPPAEGWMVATEGTSPAPQLKGDIYIPEPLPVVLLHYIAKQQNNKISLEWRTATESNNKEFIISRSANGLNFTEIGRIAGKGDWIGDANYSFSDANPLNGTNYYLLQQQDLNGKLTDLGITNVNPVFLVFSLSPNPTRSELNITFTAGDFKTLSLVDATGKLLQKHSIASSDESMRVSLADYPPGVYMVILKGEKGVRKEKVLKER